MISALKSPLDCGTLNVVQVPAMCFRPSPAPGADSVRVSGAYRAGAVAIRANQLPGLSRDFFSTLGVVR